MKPFIYMGYGVNKLIFGITGTEEPLLLRGKVTVGGAEPTKSNPLCCPFPPEKGTPQRTWLVFKLLILVPPLTLVQVPVTLDKSIA